MRDYLEQMRSLYLDRLPDGWWEQRETDRQYQEDRPAVYTPGPDDYAQRNGQEEEKKKEGRRVIIIDYNSDDEEDENKKKGAFELDMLDCPEEADSE